MATARDAKRERLLAELDELTATLDELNDRVRDLYARRLRVYRQARALSPPVTYRELAERSRVKIPAVIQALSKPTRPSR